MTVPGAAVVALMVTLISPATDVTNVTVAPTATSLPMTLNTGATFAVRTVRSTAMVQSVPPALWPQNLRPARRTIGSCHHP